MKAILCQFSAYMVVGFIVVVVLVVVSGVAIYYIFIKDNIDEMPDDYDVPSEFKNLK